MLKLIQRTVCDYGRVLLVGCLLIGTVLGAGAESSQILWSGGEVVSASGTNEKAIEWSLSLPRDVVVKSGLLLVAHKGVKERWALHLDEQRLGFLDQIEQPTWSVFSITNLSVGRLGDRVLSLRHPSRPDTIDIAKIALFDGDRTQMLSQAEISLSVRSESGAPLPCRVTILDQDGFLVPLTLASSGGSTAVRTGVVYSSDGQCRIGLVAGRYAVFVTRGPEYERAELEVELREGDSKQFAVELERSVDTSGWVSLDPHTHTFTFSRHGDATIDERVVTIAGEALEVAVATDHNIITDYRAAANRAGVDAHFTALIGDEVTTKEAHFNVFPLRRSSRLPDFRILDWTRLLGHFREQPGLDVVILNHPHNVHNGFKPFSRQHLNPVSGRILDKLDLGIDAMEVVSSSAQQSDMMLVFRDWFAILNQGYRVVGLGASDVHDVNRYIIGQGRTYLAVSDEQVGELDETELSKTLKRGRATISMGLFVTMKVNDQAGIGDLAAFRDQHRVSVTVRAPSWIQADRLELFANGRLVRSVLLTNEQRMAQVSPGQAWQVDWNLGELRHDSTLIAIATGPGDIGPSWPIPYPYQPSAATFVPRVVGATNPIWLDRDGDGHFASAKLLGERIWAQSEEGPNEALAQLAAYDEAVAVQVADIAFQRGVFLWELAAFEDTKGHVSEATRSAIEAFRESVLPSN